jgi:Uma2 family endonuclease
MTTATGIMTAEDLYGMANHGAGHELVKGELRRKGDPHNMSPTGFKHGTIVARLTGALGQHTETNDLGEVTGAKTGFKLASDPDTVRAPDLAFVRRERIPAGEFTEKYWPGAPDLAVEVISPGDNTHEVNRKIEDYIASGVRLIWIVNPKSRTVTVHQPNTEPLTLTEKDTLEGLDVVTGFHYSVAKLFTGRR